MRILIVNVNSHSGSTGKITKGLYDYLKAEGHEVIVCYRGTMEEPIDNSDFIPLISKCEFYFSVAMTRISGLEGHFSFFATRKLKRIIKDFQPDIIQAYNLHGYYINSNNLMKYLKKEGIPIVYSMLDEYAYMGKCPYPKDCDKFKTECQKCPLKKEYPQSLLFDASRVLFHEKERTYNGFEKIVFTGPPYVCQRARESFLLKNKKVMELFEPFNLEENFYPHDTTALRKKLGISEDDRVMVCASGTEPRKGGKYFLDIANLLKAESNLKFIFIGYDRKDWEFPENVIVEGFISNPHELAEYLSLADAYLCTSLGDTTPSVCLAALGCGTPLIGFDYGGVTDCAPKEFGKYVPIGDIEAMAKTVARIQKKTSKDVERIREYAVARFSPSSIYEKQVHIYNHLMTHQFPSNQ